ncbi:alpha,alpha-trehalose-phosphate synthase (UDP-forming) [Steroidobacter agaridevorans]|uniref:Trehalose-6-phosphate synthase n=1 Tax=Steroidobacter agaridevorans TaxID=2695856 RepID=A0A829Y5L7_9GAMM|nr:alpha,alpha-trehalose-phosphate synthase (UDP-forming) [Steroidobacter agaridevorans]GFE78116.1 alpha,alpha-trehalose-phosphate synthase (UDP-forming) [Steroidobacter agaridevorans]GFE91175.1 alpha,alpha-trehalose-phosphate synthase (UDP-forming) [Steroidobacter agaridevorans]
MTRLVCVSNRISLPRKSAAPGGLAVGILSALKRTGGLWFGWGGETIETEPADPDIHIREGVTYATIDLRRAEFELYYNGYSNDVLWPLFHYFSKGMRYSNEQREAYENVNRIFAQKLLPLLQPRDLIWVHDYHLIPLGRRLRELGVQRPMGFFLHIPFPNIEMLRVLPCYSELLRDLTSYDVVGFQTHNDLRSFHSGIEHLFGADALRPDGRIRIGDRTIRAEVFPIGIDVAAVESEGLEASATDVVRRMTDSLVGRSLMMGVDRLDYSKGLVERFSAYQQFLETHPENLGRITYIQIAPLSRTDVRAYAEIRQALEQAAGRTNGRFADTDWTPIRYLNRNFPHATLMGFLRAAKVGLVTPLRDGMNLVAKEFVAAQDPADPGVLILSNLAGAARELSSALLVNPYDVRGVSHAIQAALSMPLNERRERHADMMKVLRRNDIAAWTRRFMEALEQTQAPESRVRAISNLK